MRDYICGLLTVGFVDAGIIVVVLKVFQQLVVSGEMIGEAFVPYYRSVSKSVSCVVCVCVIV